MSYKTVLVHVDHSEHAAQRIRIAAQIAHTEGAHLIGAATSDGVLCGRREYAFDVPLPGADAVPERATQALAAFDTIASDAGVLCYERRLADEAPHEALSAQAPYSDIVVVSQADPDDGSSGNGPDLAEFVMLNSSRPVLIIPYAGRFTRIWKHMLVAWDGSAEATRALTAALPLLRRADRVTVALFNSAPDQALQGTAPGGDIALYLARHGVKVEVSEQKAHFDIGNALLSLAAEIDADMLVMGGYGHSRLREVLLGGVTMTILKTMTIPVLMAH